MSNDHHEGALLEDIQDRLKRLADGMAAVHADIKVLKETTASMPELQADVTVIKAVVTDQSNQEQRHDQILGDHEGRLSALEQAS